MLSFRFVVVGFLYYTVYMVSYWLYCDVNWGIALTLGCHQQDILYKYIILFTIVPRPCFPQIRSAHKFGLKRLILYFYAELHFSWTRPHCTLRRPPMGLKQKWLERPRKEKWKVSTQISCTPHLCAAGCVFMCMYERVRGAVSCLMYRSTK